MSRIAIIDKEKCKPNKCNKECMKKCPPQRQGKNVIDIEDLTKSAKINEGMCIGCNQCVPACPFNAIKIINLPTHIPQEIIHRYGDNGFQLYRFPKITKNCVLTFIGQNGIGKSTIIDILSGQLQPNFSNSGRDLNGILKGNIMKLYFNQLLNNELIFSIKKQKIKEFRSSNLTILQYLHKYDLNIDEWFDKLELQHILECNITTLSGGELQKFYCWVTCQKEANVYIFDEPTNFLDIKQRLIVAQMIKSLCNENNYVLTVEHDLSIVDYMSDKIIIIFGTPAGYGVISDPLTVGPGINEYFSGYISGLNIRFRDHEFNLTAYSTTVMLLAEIRQDSLFHYDASIIKYPSLEINIPSGQIMLNGSINIILGENGSGKTTFINYLAKNTGLSVSHKPQHLYRHPDNPLVLEYLYCNNYESPLFRSQVRNILNIDMLHNKHINELSGGELQKVMICKTLCQDANIYLLDEPSANLDIENRLACIKAIKRFVINTNKTIYIIEHDIMMCMSLALEPNSKTILVQKNENHTCINIPNDANTGINMFLKELDITMRISSYNRPRINKQNSTLDKKQKIDETYYI